MTDARDERCRSGRDDRAVMIEFVIAVVIAVRDGSHHGKRGSRLPLEKAR
ncbi:hypothetical protein [Streptomyces sp. NPDC101150]